jgi:hypothetical protein
MGSETPGSIKGEDFLHQLTYHQYVQNSTAPDNKSGQKAAVTRMLLFPYLLKSALQSARYVMYFNGTTCIYLARDSGSVGTAAATTTTTTTFLPRSEVQQNILRLKVLNAVILSSIQLLFVPTN